MHSIEALLRCAVQSPEEVSRTERKVPMSTIPYVPRKEAPLLSMIACRPAIHPSTVTRPRRSPSASPPLGSPLLACAARDGSALSPCPAPSLPPLRAGPAGRAPCALRAAHAAAPGPGHPAGPSHARLRAKRAPAAAAAGAVRHFRHAAGARRAPAPRRLRQRLGGHGGPRRLQLHVQHPVLHAARR
eukprot:350735-Chlamydomonas_euryale.AAC.8